MTDLGNAFPVPEPQSDEVETQPAPELPNLEKLETQIPDDAAAEAEPAPKPESKIRRFFRSMLRWTLGLLIVLGAGFIAAIFLLYRPEITASKIQQAELQTQLTAAEAQIADLEAQINGLSPLANENKTLVANQMEYELRILLIDARLDVSDALLALAENDPPRAQVVLDRTTDKFAAMKALLPATQSGVVTGMEQRLTLILAEIEDDPYAAQSDLDVLANSLLELEDSLFSTP